MRYFAGFFHEPDHPAARVFAERIATWLASFGIASYTSTPTPTLTLLIARKSSADGADFGPEAVARSGDLIVAGDLELYNRGELETWLSQRGDETARLTDIALVARYLDTKGTAAIGDLVADLALVTYRPGQKSGILIADSSGLRQPYYARSGTGIVFGNPAAALRASGLIETGPDVRSLMFHALTISPAPGRSYLENVIPVLPGHLLRFGFNSEPKQQSYWSPISNEPPDLEFDGAIELLEAEVKRAVSSRLHGRVAPGVLLSGGLDSALVTNWMVRTSPGKPLATYTTVNSPHGSNFHEEDETQYARAVGNRHPEITMYFSAAEKNDLLAGTAESSRLLGAPLRALVFYQKHELYDLVRKTGTRTLFTGFGGDEALSLNGAASHRDALRKGRLIEAYRNAKAVHGSPRRAFRDLVLGLADTIGLSTLLFPTETLALRHIRRYPVRLSSFTDRQWLDKYVHSAFDRPEGKKGVGDELGHHFTMALRNRNRDLDLELPYIYGIDFKCPLYDRRLVELVFRLRCACFTRRGINRRVMRELVRLSGSADIAERAYKGPFAPGAEAAFAEGTGDVLRIINSMASNSLWNEIFDPTRIAIPSASEHRKPGYFSRFTRHATAPSQIARFLES